MLTEKDMKELLDLLIEYPDSKVYLGCDSIRFKKEGKRYARYATVCIVHKNGNKGCRIFSYKSVEPDYDKNKSRPSTRLMNEAYKVCELFQQIIPLLDYHNVEIHLDVNPDPKHGSSCVAQQAAGYVLGVCGIEPVLKPDSWCASHGADGIVHGRDNSSKLDKVNV